MRENGICFHCVSDVTMHSFLADACIMVNRKVKVDFARDIYIDGLVQERRNSIANALELRLSCTNPSICCPGNGSQMT